MHLSQGASPICGNNYLSETPPKLKSAWFANAMGLSCVNLLGTNQKL
jgi:hypothetical protein